MSAPTRAYRRRPTREVRVGDVGIGAHHPIRVQSMTTPATTDVDATVHQIERLVDAGCEIVRVTVPTTADAEALVGIRERLRSSNVRVPLVADIHFTPRLALRAAELVEKVRVNPGNFADRKRFAAREYTDREYALELERVYERFAPLVDRCRELGVSMRIGTNHGSLSDRIVNRYGDTPRGMVESALEFVRISEDRGYRELVLSMKASNPVVVLEAYRDLVDRMAEERLDYPLHLGVTEAGSGEDARVKSAIGIGALLEDGIGDTVRVSLTEDPVAEIPVARALIAPYANVERRTGPAPSAVRLARARRARPAEVEVALVTPAKDTPELRGEIDRHVGPRVPAATRPEWLSIAIDTTAELRAAAETRRALAEASPRTRWSVRAGRALLRTLDRTDAWGDLTAHADRIDVEIDRALATADPLDRLVDACARDGATMLWELGDAILRGEPGVDDDLERLAAAAERAIDLGVDIDVAVEPSVPPSPYHAARRLRALLDTSLRALRDARIVLLDRPAERGADPVLGPAATLGGSLCDGIGDAIRIETRDSGAARATAFTVLQAARVRITRPEYISCPSCGRTLFDLESTTARIRARTAHLRDVKIAVMGCVVNGPGEMADADFGYVGWGEGKIALFVGREMVAKNIPAAEADDRLVALLREHGRWVEPPDAHADTSPAD